MHKIVIHQPLTIRHIYFLLCCDELYIYHRYNKSPFLVILCGTHRLNGCLEHLFECLSNVSWLLEVFSLCSNQERLFHLSTGIIALISSVFTLSSNVIHIIRFRHRSKGKQVFFIFLSRDSLFRCCITE